MTTIAFKDGYISADSNTTVGNIFGGTTKKIKIIGDIIIACAGSSRQATQFYEWVEDGMIKKDRVKLDSMRALVYRQGKIWVMERDCILFRTKAPFFAIGSGSELASGAMQFGATAEEAVKVACKLDNCSGGKVYTINCKTKEKSNE